MRTFKQFGLNLSATSTLLASCLLLGLASGCGEKVDPGPPLVPVSGIVYMDGKPLVKATLMFNPTPGTKGNGGFTVSDQEGKFTVTDYSGKPGCPVGDYGVTFSQMTLPDGSPIPDGADRGKMDIVEKMPPVYTVFNPNIIVQGAKVEPGGSTFDFQLSSKMRPPHGLFQ